MLQEDLSTASLEPLSHHRCRLSLGPALVRMFESRLIFFPNYPGRLDVTGILVA